LAGWWRDVRYSARVLVRAKLLTISVIAILGIAAGASTAVFTVLDATIFRPLHLPNASRLVRLEILADGSGGELIDPSYEDIRLLAERSRTLSAVAGMTGITAAAPVGNQSTLLGADVGPAAFVFVTGNFFDVLGVRPQVGRTLRASDDSVAADYHVAVATHRFWRDHFGLDPAALGRTVRFASLQFTIIGFLPESFEYVQKGASPALYIPMIARRYLFPELSGGSPRLPAIGLLRPGTTVKAASRELDRLWNDLGNDHTVSEQISGPLVAWDASRGIAAIAGEDRISTYLLTLAIGVTLLIACLNVSCLLVARGASRRSEIALRLALGARAGSIFRQCMVESCLLTLAGGLVGLALAAWSAPLLLTALHLRHQVVDLNPDGRVLVFSLTLALATGLVSGLLPAFEAVKTGERRLHRDEHLPALRSVRALIAAEVALSLILLAAAAMCLRGVANLESVPLGFNPQNISVIRLFPDYEMFPTGVSYERYLTAEALRLREDVSRIPETTHVAFSTGRTFRGGAPDYDARRVGATAATRVVSIHVDDNYFDLLQIPVMAGRAFTENDNDGAQRVAVLSESAARRLFGKGSPVGHQIIVGATTCTVVGLVGDIRRRSLKEGPAPTVYLPFWQPPAGRGWSAETDVHVRTRRSVGDVASIIDERLHSGRYALRLVDWSTLGQSVEASYVDDRVRTQTTAFFAAAGLLLVAAGTYGLIAYSVARRSREIGVRIAVGATSAQIVWLILKEGMMLVGFGLAFGLPGALAVSRSISALVFQVPPLDPISNATAVVVIVGVAALAAAGPAWRFTRANPVAHLREE
jgi:predicted permease